MRIIPVPVGKGKNKDILEVTIFGDFVRAACINFHYMPPHIIENILEAHHQNSCEHPNEQLADWAYLEKTHPPQYIVGLATENRNVIETILEKNLYLGKLGLSLNPVATESDLIRILKSEDVSENMRFNITKHQNLTKEVIKLFASEDCRLVIESLKLRKNIGSLIDPDVRLHFQKCGSKLIRDAFIYNKKISDF